jgi:hypothetical protein
VSFCHHLASVIRHPLTFHILIFSTETPQPNEFLPSFDSFGQVVSEEKIFLEINQSETRMTCGGHVC